MCENKCVYLCNFYLNGPGIITFDNADAAVECEAELRKAGSKDVQIMKASVQHEMGEELKAEIEARLENWGGWNA